MRKACFVFLWVLVITSVHSVLGFEVANTSIHQTSIAEASQKIIVLMKTQPRTYTTKKVITSLTTWQDTIAAEKTYILQDIITHIDRFVSCRSLYGEWISGYQECEYIEKDSCETILKGSYDACASACRHMNTGICTLGCIPVCTLE